MRWKSPNENGLRATRLRAGTRRILQGDPRLFHGHTCCGPSLYRPLRQTPAPMQQERRAGQEPSPGGSFVFTAKWFQSNRPHEKNLAAQKKSLSVSRSVTGQLPVHLPRKLRERPIILLYPGCVCVFVFKICLRNPCCCRKLRCLQRQRFLTHG